MATTRKRLHALLDELPDDRLTEAEAVIVALAAPFRPLAEAPEDDEPLTDEDLEALEQGREAYRRGETISDDIVRREFGW